MELLEQKNDESRNLRDAIAKSQSQMEQLTRNRDDAELKLDSVKDKLNPARERQQTIDAEPKHVHERRTYLEKENAALLAKTANLWELVKKAAADANLLLMSCISHWQSQSRVIAISMKFLLGSANDSPPKGSRFTFAISRLSPDAAL